MKKIIIAILTTASLSSFASGLKISCKSIQAVVDGKFVRVKADVLEDFKLTNVVMSLGGVTATSRDFQDSFGPRDLSVGAYTTYTDPTRMLRFALYLPAYKSSYENRESLVGQIFSDNFRSKLECDILN